MFSSNNLFWSNNDHCQSYSRTEAAQLKVGGQAVIEGVMMRAPRTFTVVVRKPDGELAVREDRWYSPMEKWPLLKKPFLRGCIVLIRSPF